MIAATDPQVFVPSGRQQALQHPGPVTSTHSHDDLAEELLAHDFGKVSVSDTSKSVEKWSLRLSPNYFEDLFNFDDENEDDKGEIFGEKRPDISSCSTSKASQKNKKLSPRKDQKNKVSFGASVNYKSLPITCKPLLEFMEEELYVKRNVAIWSRGMTYTEDSIREVVCTYSSIYPIKHAIFCNFYLERPVTGTLYENIPNPPAKPTPCVAIIDTQTLRAYQKNEEDFVIALTFQVSRVWTTKFGLILERDTEGEYYKNKEDKVPAIFSLSHPLDEFSPVIIKHDTLHVIEETHFQIVFTSENPSLCLMYDSRTGQHHMYKVRRLSNIEYNEIFDETEADTQSVKSTSSKAKQSVFDHVKPGLAGPSPVFSTKSNSVTNAPSKPHSPMISLGLGRPSNSGISVSPLNLRTSRLYSLMRNFDVNSTVNEFDFDATEMCNNATPQICLDYLWSDALNTYSELSNGPASKAFIIDDLNGQTFMCYLIPARKLLYLVKMDLSNPSQVSFGITTCIGAKDVTPVPILHMYALLEHSGNVILYSGLNMIGKLHVAGVLPQHIPTHTIQAMQQVTSAFPRRSSLLPTTVQPKNISEHFEGHVLSPVTSSTANPNAAGDLNTTELVALRDPVVNRINLQYADGTFLRIKVPLMASSSLVESCINALRETMHKDAFMTFIIRWYSVRNSIGSTEYTTEKEWDTFTDVLSQMLGYEYEQNDSSSDNSERLSSKRTRTSNKGDNSSWEYVLRSKQHHAIGDHLARILNLKKQPKLEPLEAKRKLKINTCSVLFPQIRIVHYTLHVLYEDLKLNILRKYELALLAEYLSKLAHDLRQAEYQLHYWKDFPETCLLMYPERQGLTAAEIKICAVWPEMLKKPTGIFQFIYDLLSNVTVLPFPYIRHVNPRTKNILTLLVTYLKYVGSYNRDLDKLVETITPSGMNIETDRELDMLSSAAENNLHRVIEMMTLMGITNRELETYPISINLFLHDVIWQCRENPPSDWPSECYTLLQRPDLSTLASTKSDSEKVPTFCQTETEQDDGMEDIDNALLKLRFPDDLRVNEVRKLLQSSKPVSVNLTQRPDVSDHDFIEEQERHLYALCSRTMALPAGRGMFTLRMVSPVITEPLTIPALNLTGKAPPRGTAVELTHIDTPSNMSFWPQFHNGVANGLRISSEAKNIDATWVVFNKPKGNTDNEHAGFLLALGLNGHLKSLATLNTFEYLSKFQEMISVAILLGLSAAYRGSSNVQVTKMLSIHIEALLPPTSMELDVPQNVQVAALLGLGLLYQGTAHRHMTEVLLIEIGRPPGPEMENSIDRESYSLSAGLALGLVILGIGDKHCGLSDLNIADQLHYYMVGGSKRPLSGPQREKYRVPSFQIKEGSTVNLDITASGATLALGLMYFQTGNRAVADWMIAPDSPYLLDAIRPDFLALRTLSIGSLRTNPDVSIRVYHKLDDEKLFEKSLIMWSDVAPTTEWVESQIPLAIKPFCMVEPNPMIDMDYEGVNQAYCNIVAGACFAVGLRYAGTADSTAYETLLGYCYMFTSLLGKSLAELAGKPTIECCLNLILLSASMVMAGTGNLSIMRIVRHLRRRVGTAASAVVTYGSHLATHMALGLLFLGGGRFTLKNDPASVAALIISFYPKYPMHSNDNRYHLQAFRHLYVLAVEPRLFIPRDIMRGKMCYANIKIVNVAGDSYYMRAPALLPELSTLKKICVDDERYWPIVFERDRNWNKLEFILRNYECIDLKQRAGYLTYTQEKDGFRTEVVESLSTTTTFRWYPTVESITSFTTDSTVRSFCSYFFPEAAKMTDVPKSVFKLHVLRATYDCVVKDKLNILPVYLSLVKTVENISQRTNYIELWQFKIASALVLKKSLCTNLIAKDGMMALNHNMVEHVDKKEVKLRESLVEYIRGRIADYTGEDLRDLVTYLIYYDVPYNFHVPPGDFFEKAYYLSTQNVASSIIVKLLDLVQ